MLPFAFTEELEPQLELARTKLEDFERSARASDVIARLRLSSPFHPTLLVRLLAVLATLGCVALTITTLAAPLLSRDLAILLARLDAAVGVPLPAVLGLRAFLGAITALGAHLGALAAGRSAPYLPHEARIHQRLVSDVKQLEAKQAVKKRMTPAPARPRLRAS